jgi:uncharacterized protein
MRQLTDRKQTILRSIESQGKLTEKLTKQILGAATTKRLEDLYLPFKPKKQTLATLARSRGLEDLAREILEADALCTDLDARAADFINTDKQIPSAADALLGAGHILAEQFSEQAELRQRLREILQRSGVLISNKIGADGKVVVESAAAVRTEARPATPETPAEGKSEAAASPESSSESPAESTTSADPVAVESSDISDIESSVESDTEQNFGDDENLSDEQVADDEQNDSEEIGDTAESSDAVEETAAAATAERVAPAAAEQTGASAPAEVSEAQSQQNAAAQRKLARAQAKQVQQQKRELKKKKLEEQRIKAFQDYFDYHEELRNIPPHRILAINRGERAKVLRVKVECDLQAMTAVIDELLVPEGHPHADYLRGCARDALTRLILPSLEREIRREMTDRAELHAVNVFAKNLRNLLLQPPVHNQRVLAVDPGFKSGCKLAALDQFGNLLEHAVIFLIGKPERREDAKKKVLDLIQRFQLTLIAVGNGTACRETENFFAELIENELKDQGVAYVIVNEAGASVYSISHLGREELPDCDATLRGAISIGRRLQDPLSELVKIDPASIGVGLYQHDVKAKHLRTSLDEVVESCVNYVGVDVNTASPALLGYISGLNQLTARRLYEYRREHGPFRNREQLREVPGFGDATFVQAAGFLKIPAGDNPLDSTWIHPESYPVANRVLERLHGTVTDLREKENAAKLAEQVAQVEQEPLAQELEVGVLTLKDILSQLIRPGRDPREDLPQPVFKRGILKLEDLAPGMELTGTVLNVVDFGCFVDIGMHDSGLVHVSRLADKFIRDPHDVVAVGDIVKVWVVEIDKERRRVSLTMVRPGSERAKQPRHGESPEGERSAGENRPPRGQRPQGQGQRPQGQRSQGQGQGQRSQGGQRQGQDQGQQGQGRPPRPAGSGDRRPPYSGRPQGGRPQSRPQTPYRPKPSPKPIVPISDAMKAGKEPLRTFGDLMQFFQQKPEGPNASSGQEGQSQKPAGKSKAPKAKPQKVTSETQEVKPQETAAETTAATTPAQAAAEVSEPKQEQNSAATPVVEKTEESDS